MMKVCFLLLCSGLLLLKASGQSVIKRSFTIDHESKTFLKDGKPFRYVSGSIHYFRIHPGLWEDRLSRMKAAGLNAIQVYVEWSLHEPRPGMFNFEGRADLVRFLELAKSLDLLIILRPGPFIDAERDMGGLPWWLLQPERKVKLRTSDSAFMKYVEKWFRTLFGRLNHLLYANGGAIIMVQVENEYGSFAKQTGFCDTLYLAQLRDLIRGLIGVGSLLFTTDGGGDLDLLRCGHIPGGVLSTTDFGPTDNETEFFHNQRLFEPTGPLVNSEFYPGWLDHWGESHANVSADLVVEKLDRILAMGANVNLYVMHGGTSFGFEAGANDPPFSTTPTSYDYDAPISEAGEITRKFELIKKVVKKYLHSNAKLTSKPTNSSKEAYGKIKLEPLGDVFGSLSHLTPFGIKRSLNPMSFEDLGQNQGFVLYEKTIDHSPRSPEMLDISGLRDRGYVFVDGAFRGVLSRMGRIFVMPLTVRKGEKLQVIVENQGRICYGANIEDRKGIVSEVKLGSKVLTNWTNYRLHFDWDVLKRLQSLPRQLHPMGQSQMTLWKGSFSIPCGEEPRDTFLSFENWTKGFVIVNGFNLGRYWPKMGPQMTLYLPKPVLHEDCSESNEIYILEQDSAECVRNGAVSRSNCFISSVDTPILNGPVPNY